MAKRPILCGIYQILNTVTGKSYIGSSKDIYSRWLSHKSDFNLNLNSIKLQRSWNFYGSSVWEFKILRECEEDNLRWLEAFWMAKFDAVKNGYNCVTIKLEDEPRGGFSTPEEVREKISKAKKGKPLSENTLASLRGRPVDEETRGKMSSAQLGRKRTEDHKARMRGRKITEETRIKLCNRRPSEETKEKIRLSCTGWKQTEEAKEKIRQSRLRKAVA